MSFSLTLASREHYGSRIVDGLMTVASILQTAYRNPEWKLSSSEIFGEIQIELRLLAKCVPLSAVYGCELLRRYVFLDAPMTVYGLDRLDRANANFLPLFTPDPFDAGGDDGASDGMCHKVLEEKMARATGDCGGVDFNDIASIMDQMKGGSATTQPRDETPHNMAVFSLTILQRIVTTEACPLGPAAVVRLVTFYDDNLTLWAGGELLGYALSTGAGIGKFGWQANREQFRRFVAIPHAVSVLAKEIAQSGDRHRYIQTAMASLTPQDWAEIDADDIAQVFVQYAFSVFDGRIQSFLRECEEPETPPENANLGVEARESSRDSWVPSSPYGGHPRDAPEGTAKWIPYTTRILCNLLLACPSIMLRFCFDDAAYFDLVERMVVAHYQTSPGPGSTNHDLPPHLCVTRMTAYLKAIQYSPFGTFLMRRFHEYDERYRKRTLDRLGGDPVDFQSYWPAAHLMAVLQYIVNKWMQLSNAQKAGYRWETLDSDTQQKFANGGLSPTAPYRSGAATSTASGLPDPATGLPPITVSREARSAPASVPSGGARGPGRSSAPAKAGANTAATPASKSGAAAPLDINADQAADPTKNAETRALQFDAVQLPQCSGCAKHDGFGTVLHVCSACRAVQYCGSDCQTRMWPQHKENCKRLSNERRRQAKGS
jgi:hypothetical protein